MTADLNNFSLATHFPSNELIQPINGKGLLVSHMGSSILMLFVFRFRTNPQEEYSSNGFAIMDYILSLFLHQYLIHRKRFRLLHILVIKSTLAYGIAN